MLDSDGERTRARQVVESMLPVPLVIEGEMGNRERSLVSVIGKDGRERERAWISPAGEERHGAKRFIHVTKYVSHLLRIV